MSKTRQFITTRVAWTRWGVRAWEEEVNNLIHQGWRLDYTQVEGKLRLVLIAAFSWRGPNED